MDIENLRFVVGEEENPARVDKYLSAILPDLSRSQLQRLIKQACVQVNGKLVKAHRQVAQGDVIALQLPQPISLAVEPQDIPIDILYEDADLLVINKPPAMVVHPAPGNLQGTLVNALLYCIKDLSSINGVLRPGIVHRLDKDTSGCLLVAKNDRSHVSLSQQFESRTIQKEYLALVWGRMMQASGIIDMRIGRHPIQRKKMAVRPEGRDAITHYERLEEMGGCTLLSLRPKTGRTHQLRVHLASMGFPILGDLQYARRRPERKFTVPVPRQMLHAASIAFIHPSSNQVMRFQAPIPQDMQDVIEALRGESDRT